MSKNPKAFEGINGLGGSYWGNDRPALTALAKKVEGLIPADGPVAEPRKNKALEKFRKASNCYYDLYNNGLCNRAAEFRAVFGFGGFNATAAKVESKMDELLMAAAIEQGVK